MPVRSAGSEARLCPGQSLRWAGGSERGAPRWDGQPEPESDSDPADAGAGAEGLRNAQSNSQTPENAG